MSEITLLAIDTAKSVFELLGLDGSGREVFRRKSLRRSKLLETVAQLGPCEVVMEACGGSHHWGRCFQGMGHRVRLIAPQFVKPYRRGQKNDARDVEAIASAACAPKMRFVGVKTDSAQAIRALHRVRRRIVREKVSISNQLRGLLAEHGEVFAKGDPASWPVNVAPVDVGLGPYDYPRAESRTQWGFDSSSGNALTARSSASLVAL